MRTGPIIRTTSRSPRTPPRSPSRRRSSSGTATAGSMAPRPIWLPASSAIRGWNRSSITGGTWPPAPASLSATANSSPTSITGRSTSRPLGDALTEFLRGVGERERRFRDRHAQKAAQRLPALRRFEHQQPLGRDGALDLLIVPVEHRDHVLAAEILVECLLADQ